MKTFAKGQVQVTGSVGKIMEMIKPTKEKWSLC